MELEKINQIFQELIKENIIFDGTFLEISECHDKLECGFHLNTDYKGYTVYGDKQDYLSGNWEMHDRNSLKSNIEDTLLNDFSHIMFIPYQWQYFPNIDNEYFSELLDEDFEDIEISQEVKDDFDIELLLNDGIEYVYLYESVGFEVIFENKTYYLHLES